MAVMFEARYSSVSELSSIGTDASGVDCRECSSLVFLSFSLGSSLTTFGGPFGCGICSGLNQFCNSLHFVNDSYISAPGSLRGSGIGSGCGTSNGNSSVVMLLIEMEVSLSMDRTVLESDLASENTKEFQVLKLLQFRMGV
jgi:hypothetical protein